MKTGKILLALLLTLSLASCKSSVQKPTPDFDFSEMNESTFPKPTGYVNDFEQVFTIDQKNKLEKTISDYEKETTREIAIVTVNSIEPYDKLANFALDLSNEWAVGKAKKDNGLVIVFSKSLRQIRISTGNGTMEVLTDEMCQNIIDQTMIPEFKNEEYFSGIEKGLTKLIAKWN